jgi:hypothetical protein
VLGLFERCRHIGNSDQARCRAYFEGVFYPLKGIRLSALGQSAGAVGILSTKGNKLSRVDPNVALTVSNVCPRIPGGIAGETVSRQIPDADKSRAL